MSKNAVLGADLREKAGKGAARAIRREGRVPAVIYGDKKPPVSITLNYRELVKHIGTGAFLTTLFDIDAGGEKTRVIPRDIQFDPVRDFPMHVDFLRLGEGATIAVEIPVHFVNDEESPGIERGGVLNVVRYTVELLCPAISIPDFIEADLTGLEIGDSIHISDIPLPDGVTPTITDRDFTVATIASPAALTAEEEAGEDEEDLEGEEGEEGEGEEGEDGEGDGEESEGDGDKE